MLIKTITILIATPIALAFGWVGWTFTQAFASNVAAIDPVAAVAIMLVGVIVVVTAIRDLFIEALK